MHVREAVIVWRLSMECNRNSRSFVAIFIFTEILSGIISYRYLYFDSRLMICDDDCYCCLLCGAEVIRYNETGARSEGKQSLVGLACNNGHTFGVDTSTLQGS